MNTKRIAAIFTVLALLASPVWADWMPGDGHKMHFPQLPDPFGWDVDITTDYVFDDWKCSDSGPVSDIHFWISWNDDFVGQIAQVWAEIWTDVPVGGDPDPNVTWSHPGGRLWQGVFNPSQFIVGPPETGDQGWISPNFTQPQWNRPDHQQYFQVNIPQIDDPFLQEEGTIYWLGLHIIPTNLGPMAGWKTSQDHFQDDAVYRFGGWKELRDPDFNGPNFGQSLDMAFVITIPEPATLGLLAMGFVGVFAFPRRRD